MTYQLDRDSLRDFGVRVLTEAGREISLLSAIDGTLDHLRLMQKLFGALAKHAEEVAHRLQSLKNAETLFDPDGKLSTIFEQGQSAAEAYYRALVEMRETAKNDPRIDDEDCVVEAFTEAIATAADLQNALNELRWAIGEHDADIEKPTGKEFDDVDALFANMGL